ncbi:MAG TPA: hypothetical protein VH481_00375 [Nitrososphaeraceae archaeon]|jgi:hypothetical protein
MHTKFVIFLAISTVFVAAIYSSSVSVVFGATTSCYNTDKTHSSCTVSETDAAGKLTQTFWDCTYHKSTKTWSCVEASAPPPPPPGISDAIVKAQSHLSAAGAATEGGNTGGSNNTSVLQGKVLKHGGALKGGETDNNASTNSSDPLQ